MQTTRGGLDDCRVFVAVESKIHWTFIQRLQGGAASGLSIGGREVVRCMRTGWDDAVEEQGVMQWEGEGWCNA